MAEKNKNSKICSMYEFENEIRKLVSFGKRKRDILDHMKRATDDNFIKNDMALKSCVESVLNDIVGYPWISKVMRSKIVYDIEDETYYLFDPEYNEKQKTKWAAITKHFNIKMNLSDKVYMCKFEYDPLNSEVIKDSGTGYYIYNTYTPPFWYKDYYFNKIPIEPVYEIPEIYDIYLNHLLNNHKESYDYVLDWLSHAIKDRNRCALVTIGASGIGKGILGEIMRGIFDDKNFEKTEDDVFKFRFNSQIKNKRLIYIDEFSIKTVEMENKLKSMANDTIKVEGKGEDAEEVKNYANMYMSSNNFDSLKLSPDDRRFSIVELTKVPLKDLWTKPQISKLLEPENISQFARFLYFRDYDSNKMIVPYKAKYAEKIKSASLFEWQEWFLDDYCIDHAGKSVTLEAVRDAIGEKMGYNKSPGYAKFQKLEEAFPNKLHVLRKREGHKRVWYIEIKSLKEQGVE